MANYPLEKAAIFNTALPASGSDWLASDIETEFDPGYLLIYVSVSIAGIFKVTKTVSGVPVTKELNSGLPLAANGNYAFTERWRAGDTVNFSYSATGGTILEFSVDELGGPV